MRRLSFLALLVSGCLGSYGGGSTGGGSTGSGGSTGGGSTGGGSSDPGPAPSGAPTYYADVLPVFQKSCLQCHDSAAPNATRPYLDHVDEVKASANVILADVMSRRMPPFPPEPGCNSYVDERRLASGDEQTIMLWAMMGAYAGDPQSAPSYKPPPANPLGAPDQHLVAPTFTPHYPGSAGANDLYWCFPLPPGIGASSDLVAMNIVPGSKGQVHHVIVFRDPGGQGSAGQPAGGYECNGAPGEMLDGWVPGARPLQLPSGVGMTIDPSDRLLMQVHYHQDPSVTIAPDATAVDLYFAKSTLAEHAYVVWSGTPLFTIPASTTGYAVNSTCTANGSWKLYGIAPHMHQHATAFRSDLTVAGAGQCLMNIAHWDFGWQGGYFLSQPVTLAAGDTVRTTCTYDNPSSSQIKFGEATTDEMCFGFLYVVAPSKPTFNGVVNLFGGANASSICAN